MAAPKDHAREARLLLARNIRIIRRERGLTQEALSLETGIMQSYLSEIEAGKRNVSIDNIGTLAHALGVPITRLFGEP